jgi:hypothetical protein
MGLGLRLSGIAAETLVEPATLAASRTFSPTRDAYVFTINGFPYGPFHGVRVKEEVYQPDWSEPERCATPTGLADILAELLPEGHLRQRQHRARHLQAAGRQPRMRSRR